MRLEPLLLLPSPFGVVHVWLLWSMSLLRLLLQLLWLLLDVVVSVAVAVADVFSKNYHSIPNKIDKILKLFDRLDNVKSRGVIFYT